MKRMRCTKLLSILLSTVMIMGATFFTQVEFVNAVPEPEPSSATVTIGSYDDSKGTVEYFVVGEEGSHKADASGVTVTAHMVKIYAVAGYEIDYSKLEIYKGGVKEDVGFEGECWYPFNDTTSRTISNIVFVEAGDEDRGPACIKIADGYDSTKGTIKYTEPGEGGTEKTVPAEGMSDPVEACKIEIIPNEGYKLKSGWNLSVHDYISDVSLGDEDDPVTNFKGWINGPGRASDGEGLEPGMIYTLSGIEFEAEVQTPGTLTINPYTNTYGYLEYKDATGNWIEVPAAGVNDVSATEVRATGRQPKYTLKYTRDDITGYTLIVTGEDGDQIRNDFESHMNRDGNARILEGHSYTLSGIEFEAGQATFRWSYEEGIPGHIDEYVGHGIITITGATYNGSAVVNNASTGGFGWKNDSSFTENGRTWSGGEGIFEAGTIVTVTMTPDRGYQLTEFTINGEPNTTKAEGNISTFTFKVPSKNFHLAAKFTPMQDKVDSNVSGISGGSISGLTESDISKGTAALTVNNTAPDNSDEFTQRAERGGYTVDKFVDLKVENRFYKGNTTDYWKTEKSDLSASATIALETSDLSGSEVEIIHEKHDGSFEVIPATYENGRVVFKASSFSNFAIVSKGSKPSTATPTVEEKEDSKSENESTPVVKKPETLGTVVGGATVKNWDDLEKVIANKSVATATTNSAKIAAKAPIVLELSQNNATIPVSTIQTLQKSDSKGLHLLMGNGASVTISNGTGLKNQGAINLTNKVTQTKNSKTIAFTTNTKLFTLAALHMSVPKNVSEAKLYIIINGQPIFLGLLKPANGQVLFPITQLGTYRLVY